MFMIGLIMCTNGGMYVLQLIDNYAATFSALVIGAAEISVISWHYGIDRFLDDIKLMLGHDAPPRWYWRFVWKFFTPLVIVVRKILKEILMNNTHLQCKSSRAF